MILTIDVYYHNTNATATGVTFPSWESETPIEELVLEIEQAAEYLPGQFYLRELPCIMAILERVKYPLDCIVIDGFVWLGARLWGSMEGRVPVIGWQNRDTRGRRSKRSFCGVRAGALCSSLR